MTIRLLTLLLLGVVLPSQSPQSVADELLAADRAASVAGAKTTVIPALIAMFAPDVAMQAPVVGFARGLAAATEALRGNPDNIDGRIEWLPVRSGISADGQHGFTFGFMTLRRPDGTTVPVKYLAYWVKRDGRWEVAAYKRRLRPAGDVNTTVLAPSLPAQLQPVASDAATLAGHRQSLIAAEQAFSDEAQTIGIGAAFAKYGSADAMNMGGPNDAIFVMGADAIGKAVGGTEPSSTSPVNWSADSAIVASGAPPPLPPSDPPSPPPPVAVGAVSGDRLEPARFDSRGRCNGRR